MRTWSMVLAALGCLYGAAGVALAAAGAHHGASPLVATAASFLLVHAAAIVALSATARPGLLLDLAASLLAAGAALFSGELALHGLASLQPLADGGADGRWAFDRRLARRRDRPCPARWGVATSPTGASGWLSRIAKSFL